MDQHTRYQADRILQAEMAKGFSVDATTCRFLVREYYGGDPWLEVAFEDGEQWVQMKFIHDPVWRHDDVICIRQPHPFAGRGWLTVSPAFKRAIERVLYET